MKVLVALLTGIGVVAGSAAAQSPSQPAVVTLLSAYEAGRTEEALARVQGADFRAMLQQMRQHAPRWISQGTKPEQDGRRQVAALFALEAAHAALPSPEAWRDVRPLLEWACVQIRHGEPDEFERLWLLASLALLQGADDSLFQLGRQGSDPYFPAGHIAHATQRFRDEPRFQLAAIVADMPGRFLANRPQQLLPSLAPRGRNSLTIERNARRVVKELAELEGVPGIAVEARTRRGILLFNLGDVEGALAALEPASLARVEPFLAHVGHLIAGLSLAARDRHEEARVRYEAARALFPRALSASLLHGSALHLAGRPGEAEAMVAGALAAPRASDPWREFRLGTFHKWEKYLSQLRSRNAP